MTNATQNMPAKDETGRWPRFYDKNANRVRWGNLGHFHFLLNSPKLKGLAARSAIMDCISP